MRGFVSRPEVGPPRTLYPVLDALWHVLDREAGPDGTFLMLPCSQVADGARSALTESSRAEAGKPDFYGAPVDLSRTLELVQGKALHSAPLLLLVTALQPDTIPAYQRFVAALRTTAVDYSADGAEVAIIQFKSGFHGRLPTLAVDYAQPNYVGTVPFYVIAIGVPRNVEKLLADLTTDLRVDTQSIWRYSPFSYGEEVQWTSVDADGQEVQLPINLSPGLPEVSLRAQVRSNRSTQIHLLCSPPRKLPATILTDITVKAFDMQGNAIEGSGFPISDLNSSISTDDGGLILEVPAGLPRRVFRIDLVVRRKNAKPAEMPKSWTQPEVLQTYKIAEFIQQLGLDLNTKRPARLGRLDLLLVVN